MLWTWKIFNVFSIISIIHLFGSLHIPKLFYSSLLPSDHRFFIANCSHFLCTRNDATDSYVILAFFGALCMLCLRQFLSLSYPFPFFCSLFAAFFFLFPVFLIIVASLSVQISLSLALLYGQFVHVLLNLWNKIKPYYHGTTLCFPER